MIVESDRTAEPRKKSLEEAKKSLKFRGEYSAACPGAVKSSALLISADRMLRSTILD